ncbi:MAG: DUF3489 domain-containing protein [Rhizomicrobium sp.]
MQKKSKQPKSTGRKVSRAAAAAKRISARSVAKNLGAARAGSKLEQIATLLRRPSGATIEQLVMATGWQSHSVRGAISGSLKKKLGLAVVSDKAQGLRIYRLAAA